MSFQQAMKVIIMSIDDFSIAAIGDKKHIVRLVRFRVLYINDLVIKTNDNVFWLKILGTK